MKKTTIHSKGHQKGERASKGPRTYLKVMAEDFPNLAKENDTKPRKHTVPKRPTPRHHNYNGKG